MAVTTDSVLTNTMPTVLSNARFTQMFKTEMAGLVWRIRKELHDGKTVNLPTWGTVTTRDLTEGVDNVVSETMSDALVTITPSEKGCKLILTDKVVRDDNEDVKAAAGRILGDSYAFKEDRDLLDSFASAATLLGNGGTLTMGEIAAAASNLLSAGGP